MMGALARLSAQPARQAQGSRAPQGPARAGVLARALGGSVRHFDQGGSNSDESEPLVLQLLNQGTPIEAIEAMGQRYSKGGALRRFADGGATTPIVPLGQNYGTAAAPSGVNYGNPFGGNGPLTTVLQDLGTDPFTALANSASGGNPSPLASSSGNTDNGGNANGTDAGNGGASPSGGSGTASSSSTGGVSPAGVGMGLGDGLGSLGNSLAGLGLSAVGAPPGTMSAIDTIAGAIEANNALSKEGAPNISVSQGLSALLNEVTHGLFGTSMDTAAEQNNNSTAAAQGIGISTGSVDVGNSLTGSEGKGMSEAANNATNAAQGIGIGTGSVDVGNSLTGSKGTSDPTGTDPSGDGPGNGGPGSSGAPGGEGHGTDPSGGTSGGTGGGGGGGGGNDAGGNGAGGGGDGPGCFTAETLILMGDRSFRPISEVRPGDMVMAFATICDLQPARVTCIMQHEPQPILVVNGVSTTAEHPFLASADGVTWDWVLAGKLTVGMFLLSSLGHPVKIREHRETGEKHTVFNLTVDRLHTYVAGGYRVHNKYAHGGYIHGRHKSYGGAGRGALAGAGGAGASASIKPIAKRAAGGALASGVYHAVEGDGDVSFENSTRRAMRDRMKTEAPDTGDEDISWEKSHPNPDPSQYTISHLPSDLKQRGLLPEERPSMAKGGRYRRGALGGMKTDIQLNDELRGMLGRG